MQNTVFLNTAEINEAVFRDRVLTALRYAQKAAVSHRRPVCVNFNDSRSLTLQIAANPANACGTALLIPGANGNQIVSSNIVAQFSPLPATSSPPWAADSSARRDVVPTQITRPPRARVSAIASTVAAGIV